MQTIRYYTISPSVIQDLAHIHLFTLQTLKPSKTHSPGLGDSVGHKISISRPLLRKWLSLLFVIVCDLSTAPRGVQPMAGGDKT